MSRETARARLAATLDGETVTLVDMSTVTPDDLDELANEYIQSRDTMDLLFLRLRAVRGQARIADSLLRMVKGKADEKLATAKEILLDGVVKAIGPQPLSSKLTLPAILGDLSRVVVPVGYEVTRNGVFKVRHSPLQEEPQRTVLAHSPLFPVRLDTDIMTGRSHLVMAWMDATDRWRTARLARKQALEPRGLHSLADHGAPINLNSSVRLVDWVSEFEAANSTTLPKRTTASRMGWFDLDDKPGFLLGESFLSDEPEAMGLVPPPNYEEHSQSWHTAGTGKDWMEGLLPLTTHPLAMLAIYAALAAPLLHVIDAPSFVVDWSGETSGGKTTVLALAMSVFGHPQHGLLSWEDTPTHIERVAGYLHNLPLIVDDTKRAQSPSKLAKTVYQFAQGRGKGRGVVDGLQTTARWRSVLLSSGEAPIVSYGQDGGSRARAVLIRGRPLGYDNEEGRELAAQVNATIAGNYGHIGRAFIQQLVGNREQWPQLRQTYHQRVARIAKLFQGRVEGRIASYLAAIDMAGVMFHGLQVEGFRFPKPLPQYDPIDHAVQEIKRCASVAAYDLPFEALEHTINWVAVNEARFYGRATYHGGNPPGGWVGAWESGDKWESIAIIPSALNDVLKRNGYHPPEIIERWIERGFLAVDKRQHKIKTYVGGNRPRCFVIQREAVDKLL